ncbi:zinc finger MYM-type 1-like [Paramuricea clavata]|uniref:Zinc finger MYM-type 1-like n=1 Tax=Paramuricea clavata TaxID=317549 RepID=A0A7D9L5Y8_PARCT|nr:zinc finger MYM-type 1-like [Paramuricea clavata]
MGEALTKLVDKDPNRWSQHLPDVQLAYNTAVHTSTRVSPYELVFKEHLRSKFEIITEKISPAMVREKTELLHKTVSEVFQKAHESDAKLAENAENGTTVKLRLNRWGWVNKFGKEIYEQKHLQIGGRDLMSCRTSKRQDVYKEFQAFFNAQPLKILSPAQTRWLSLQECANQLLEQFEALTHYFTLTANEDPSHSNDRILASLQNRFTQAYLEFLSYQLERLNAFNRLFQSERPLLHMLKPEIESLIKSIACDFMKINIVKSTSPNKLNPTDVNQHVPLSETYVGLGATATIHEIASVAGKADVDNFLTTCKNLLIESILQIQSRFDIDDPVHEIIQCLLPSSFVH